MTDSYWKTGSPASRREPIVWPSPAQALRQLAIVAIVSLVWAVLFLGYLRLTKPQNAAPGVTAPEPVAVMITPTSTSSVTPLAPTHTAAATSIVETPATPTPTATPEPTVAESPSPEPSPTSIDTRVPSPTPTDTPARPSSTPTPTLEAIAEPTRAGTPSPEPSPTPTDAPAPSPTPTATATPSPTWTSTPTSSPTLTSTPTPSPAPTDTPAPPSSTPTLVPETGVVSFSEDVLPIFQRRCVKCHGGEKTEEGLILKTYADVMAGSWNGPVIEPGSAADSFLVEQIVSGEMPKNGPRLLPAEIRVISDWIDAGALDN